MKPITETPGSFVKSRLYVARPKFPKTLLIGDEIGRGSNNKAFEARLNDEECILRAPRRSSDTQQKGAATWEFRHTLKASQLGVGPLVYDAFYAKHSDDEWPSGLYMILERFPYDLDKVLTRRPRLRELALRHKDALGAAIVDCLAKLADQLLVCFDLKPGQLLVRFPEDGAARVEVRICDFGREFCEWGGCEQVPDASTPVLDMLRKRIAERDASGSPKEVDAVVKHVIFGAMLVMLAATTTRALHDDRRDHKLGKAERAALNPVAPLAHAFLESMQGQNLALLREVLRHDEVKGVLAHYHDRRCAGTRRTLRYAAGVEW